MRESTNPINLTPILTFFQHEAKRFSVLVALLYGSWAGGLARPDSDIDIAVVFENGPDEDTVYRRLMEMSLLLSDLTVREVNMIPIYPDFRKPMLYYNALVHSIPVYMKHPEDLNFLRKKAIAEMEDFSLFGLRWQAALTRRNLEVLRHA